jgi:hypothetical protein
VATNTLTTYNEVLKDWYVDGKIKELSYAKNWLLALIQKDNSQQAGGRAYIQPIDIELPGGASADFGEGMTNNTANLYDQFVLSRKAQYQRVLVDYELLAATKDKRSAFNKAMDLFDKGFRSFGSKLGKRLYRTVGGSVGRLALSSTTTTTLTFEDRAQIFNVMIGMKLQFSATDGTGSLLDGGDFVTVTGVDHRNNQCTIDADLATTINGVATTSYAFQKGDYNACVNGLEDWLPVDDRVTRLAASYNSVTRSVAPVYLGGVYVDGTAMALDEVLINLVGEVGLYGGDTDTIIANPRTISDMQLLAGSRLKMEQMEGEMRSASGEVLVGFNGFKSVIGDKTVRVMGDRHCPMTRVYALSLPTWTLYHAGEFVNWLGEEVDGNKLAKAQNEPSAEARLGNWCNLGCSAPGHNGVAKINASSN